MKINKVMFYVGLVLVAISAVLLVGGFAGKSGAPILGIIGIIFIGASGFRPLNKF